MNDVSRDRCLQETHNVTRKRFYDFVRHVHGGVRSAHTAEAPQTEAERQSPDTFLAWFALVSQPRGLQHSDGGDAAWAVHLQKCYLVLVSAPQQHLPAAGARQRFDIPIVGACFTAVDRVKEHSAAERQLERLWCD